MKLLVLSTSYSDNEGNISLMYIHVRNKYYISKGFEVEVLNFKTRKSYFYDGVKVISLSDYFSSDKKYDVVISHAPNLRNHFRFLEKEKKSFQKIILIFHGHEILMYNEAYPEPYDFLNSKNVVKKNFRNSYDKLKFIIWKRFIKKNIEKLELIFVGEWLKNQFINNIIDDESVNKKIHIISNSVGEIFEKQNYDENSKKTYDFITIRSDYDISTYAIDLLTLLAEYNKDKSFCLVGRGNYFKYNKKPKNLIVINNHLNHGELIDIINKSKNALMLVRHDTQGVMSCELATFGINLITSDIPITRTVFKNFDNVYYVNNKKIVESFNELVINNHTSKKTEDYFKKNTIDKEIELIRK